MEGMAAGVAGNQNGDCGISLFGGAIPFSAGKRFLFGDRGSGLYAATAEANGTYRDITVKRHPHRGP